VLPKYSYCWLPIEAVLKRFFAGRGLPAELAGQKAYLGQSEFTINITIRKKKNIEDILSLKIILRISKSEDNQYSCYRTTESN
jgi:hypothetical protein